MLASGLAAKPKPKPNVIFILCDDFGYGDVGCHNKESKLPTPHLDKLVADGMRFTDAHSGSALSTATRYGVVTGRYSWCSSRVGCFLDTARHSLMPTG